MNTQPQSRTHRAMREEMQARLIDATAQMLVERGYAHTSVQAICDRAAVTKGALFRHYERRTDLLAAAAQHIFSALTQRFAERFIGLAPGSDFARRTVELLRDHMSDPLMQAAQELQTAARTDNVLHETLGPVFEDYRHGARLMATQLFPNASVKNPDFEAVVDVFLSALSEEATCARILPETDAEADRRGARLNFLARLADSEILRHEPGLTQSRTGRSFP
ncbi:MAG: helix-turn-helix domain-containing protein [Pseudomonadota bacterium]